MAFRNWVKNCFDSLVDPDKDEEIAELTTLLNEEIARQKRSFVLANVLGDRGYKQRHLDQAKNNLYDKFLSRAWRDGCVQTGERETLAWVAHCLEIPAATVRSIELQHAHPRFAEALATAMDDGEVTEAEAAVLDGIAQSAGLPLSQFVKEFFRSEGESFLRGIFAAAVADSHSPTETLERLVVTAGRLGLSHRDVLQAIKPQAVLYIEHALADAKEDDVLAVHEEYMLQEVLDQFALPDDVREYAMLEIEELRALTQIKKGILPSLKAPNGVSLKAGELVHYHGPAVWDCLKLLKNGPSRVEHCGLLTIADSRMVFSSPTRSDSFSFGRVVGYDLSHGLIELQVKGKPMQRFICTTGGRLPAAIFGSALAMANQSLINQDESRRSRHIPRDVRQRVWQRYGGRCAECSATSYLEFDHIVPVARGGSNSDANVQLLCRGCNSKKSDMI